MRFNPLLCSYLFCVANQTRQDKKEAHSAFCRITYHNQKQTRQECK